MFESEIKKLAGKRDFTFKICWEDRYCTVVGMLPNLWQSLKERRKGGENAFYGLRVSICSGRKQISLEGMILLLYSSSNYFYKLEGRVITQQIPPNRALFLNITLHWQINGHGVSSKRPVCRFKSKTGCTYMPACIWLCLWCFYIKKVKKQSPLFPDDVSLKEAY